MRPSRNELANWWKTGWDRAFENSVTGKARYCLERWDKAHRRWLDTLTKQELKEVLCETFW